MRVTLIVRENQGLNAKMQARTKAQKQRVLAATKLNKDEEFALVIDRANKDTGYMATQTQSEFTYGGYGYRTGYHARDFIGKMNNFVDPPRLITRFYPKDVHDGTRFYAGNPFLESARRTMRPIVRQRLAKALSGG